MMMMLLLYANVRFNFHCSLIVLFSVPDIINSNCKTDEVRLTGGSDKHEGKVEYCVNGVWQSICDYEWDSGEAFFLCRQLGYVGITREIIKLLCMHLGNSFVTSISFYVLCCHCVQCNNINPLSAHHCNSS